MLSVNRARPAIDITRQNELTVKIGVRQNEISTGKKSLKPSDDPAASAQISALASLQTDIAAWRSNADRAASIAEQSAQAISAITNIMQRAMELVTFASNDTISSDDRFIIAQELNGVGGSINEILRQNDPFGQSLFPIHTAIRVPVNDRISIAPALSRQKFSGLESLFINIPATITNGTPEQRSHLIDQVKTQLDQLANIEGAQGITLGKIKAARQHLTEQQIDIAAMHSSIEDADVSQSIIEMQTLLTTLEAAQASYARIKQSSLFDRIR